MRNREKSCSSCERQLDYREGGIFLWSFWSVAVDIVNLRIWSKYGDCYVDVVGLCLKMKYNPLTFQNRNNKTSLLPTSKGPALRKNSKILSACREFSRLKQIGFGDGLYYLKSFLFLALLVLCVCLFCLAGPGRNMECAAFTIGGKEHLALSATYWNHWENPTRSQDKALKITTHHDACQVSYKHNATNHSWPCSKSKYLISIINPQVAHCNHVQTILITGFAPKKTDQKHHKRPF